MALRMSGVMPTLAVTDLKRAKEFYGKLLGLQEVQGPSTDESGVLYRVAEGSYLYLYERQQPSGSTATSCAFSVEDVPEAVSELRGRGVKFEEYDLPELGIKTADGIAQEGAMKSAWFLDPFGNILAIDDALAVAKREGLQVPAQAGAKAEARH